LNILTLQPEVDPNRISIIGHSQGTIIAPRVAIDNSAKVKNIILMGIVASNSQDLVRGYLPSEYASQVLDKNRTGLISIQQIANDHMLRYLLVPYPAVLTFLRTNNTEVISDALVNKFANNNWNWLHRY
jgi:pimeloyl-ACP methyl ester carboxylesterase